ncbi:MAG: hypothetical protein ACT4OY_05255 [Alphaproteobacteria bacterium]
MNKYIFIISFLALSGCVTGASQNQLNSAMQKAEQASANCPMAAMPYELSSAWEMSQKLTEKKCPALPKNSEPTPDQVEKTSNCWESIVKEHISPVTKNKKALNNLLAANRKVKQDFQTGNIDRSTARARNDQNWADYAVREISYFQLAQCQNASLQHNVMPVYHNKAELADFMAQRSEIALKIDQGKLTPQEGDIQLQKAFAEFASSEQNANATLRAQNAQEWQAYSARMGQVSQQLLNAEAAQQQSSSIRNSNCQFIGNQMQCQSW